MAEQPSDVPEVSIDVNKLPRIEPLSYDEADEETRKAWDELRPAPGGPRHRADVDNDLFRTFMHHWELYGSRSAFSRFLMTSTNLPARHHELAILRSAWLGGVDDQWVNHSKMGLDCGLTPHELGLIAVGPDADGWSAFDSAVLRAVDELHHWCRIGDDTWAILASQYDKRQLIELLMLVGSYRALSYVQNSIGVRPVTGTSPDISGNRFLFPAP